MYTMRKSTLYGRLNLETPSIFSTRQRPLVDMSPKGVTKLEENFKADANDFIIV